MKARKILDKRRTDLLKFSVSKDETRLHLNSIWHDDKLGALVSTNGHHATILKSRYSPELSNKLIDPNTFQIIHREPVKIAAVIPSKFQTTLNFTIEKHHFVNTKNRPTHAHFFNDGTVSIGLLKDLGDKEGRLFTVNAAYLKHLVGGTYAVGTNNELSPVAFSLDHECLELANDIYIIMPLKV